MIDEIKNCHIKFASERGADKTYCPSEVARELYPNNWREKMDLVRKAADDLVENGQVEVLQKKSLQLIKPSMLSGPIRLRKKN
ncbi:MAG: DUF3253 domain-containing protein [Patiriisocius sp.]|uniref:DUF3253 domain-containing protein n=1 Tax=Patiriisocius sp. TaxID=2822396 RepID=UPI003EF3BE0A